MKDDERSEAIRGVSESVDKRVNKRLILTEKRKKRIYYVKLASVAPKLLTYPFRSLAHLLRTLLIIITYSGEDDRY